jgi:PAP2 superfamily
MFKVIINICIFCLIITFIGCKHEPEPLPIVPTPIPETVLLGSDAAVLWGQMTLKTMTKLPKTTPTYGSRALGYMGITMYETVVNGSPKNFTMAGQLNGLATLPTPIRGTSINYVLAMNAGQAYMLKNLFEYAEFSRLYSIDSLESVILKAYQKTENQEETDRSIAYGRSVAAAIYEWSKTDGGYLGYDHNFISTYMFPSGPSYWVPPLNGQVVSLYPLHPFWGQNRTFVPNNNKISVPKMVAFSTVAGSEYYKMMNEVYQKNITLTQSEKEIAAWWGDDPSETFTPPGHSYSIANQVIKNEKVDLYLAAETYARVGIAVADAFINCWKAKYTYHCERPSSYVRQNINPSWTQFWPEPPFPAFYSGHATQGASCATVLEAMYGTNYSFLDTSHEGREKDQIRNVEFKPRKFNSFWEAAQESAMSRFYGGIHTKSDNDIGLVEGKKVGENVNALNWKAIK